MIALWLIAFAPAKLLAEVPCTGDCNGDGSVTVNEVVALVRIVLNEVPVSTCGSGDANGDGQVTVNEIVLAVNSLLGRCGFLCGNGSTEGDEQCDDGGICLGTAKAGSLCTAEHECWTPNDAWKGVCQGGATPYRFCNHHSDCPDGRCVACWTVGGDGCSARCTAESSRQFAFRFVLDSTPSLPPSLSGSSSNVEVARPLETTGRLELIVGDERRGVRPIAVPAASVHFDALPISTLACACLRAAEYQTCGGALFFPHGSPVESCTTGFAFTPAECPESRPCASVFGPGNAAAGTAGCRTLEGADLDASFDCSTGTPVYQLSALGDPGTIVLTTALATGTVAGRCGAGSCSEADPFDLRGVPAPGIFTTGTACVSGCTYSKPRCAEGQAISCGALGNGELSELALCTATGGVLATGQEFLSTACIRSR